MAGAEVKGIAPEGGNMMETVLSVNGLCKYYKRDKALDGLSLTVPKGAIYGLYHR